MRIGRRGGVGRMWEALPSALLCGSLAAGEGLGFLRDPSAEKSAKEKTREKAKDKTKDSREGESRSKSQEENAIRSAVFIHIADALRKNDGCYEVVDPRSMETVPLAFRRFHDEIETGKKGDVWSLCVDFEDEEGVPYDVDFFVGRNRGGKFAVLSHRVHRVDGKEVGE